jgi:hypothetical protein
LATCPSCGSALAAPLAPGDVCVLNPEGTTYEHRAPASARVVRSLMPLPPKPEPKSDGWLSTADALESEPEPRIALKDEAEIEAKPKRRGK